MAFRSVSCPPFSPAPQRASFNWDGVTFSITYPNTLAHFAASVNSGLTLEERRCLTREWIKQQLVARIGEDGYRESVVQLDFDHTTGRIVFKGIVG